VLHCSTCGRTLISEHCNHSRIEWSFGSFKENWACCRRSNLIDSLATKQFEYLHGDQPLEVALERFGNDLDVLPVVSRRGRKVEGIITLDTILEFIQKKPAQVFSEQLPKISSPQV